MDKDQKIVFSRGKIIQALKNLNGIIVSLDRIGSATSDADKTTRMKILTNFIEDWAVFRKLVEVRTILSDGFSKKLGPDDMDELERELEHVEFWKASE